MPHSRMIALRCEDSHRHLRSMSSIVKLAQPKDAVLSIREDESACVRFGSTTIPHHRSASASP